MSITFTADFWVVYFTLGVFASPAIAMLSIRAVSREDRQQVIKEVRKSLWYRLPLIIIAWPVAAHQELGHGWLGWRHRRLRRRAARYARARS